MITAIDTNILLDILIPNEEFYEASADALEDAAGEGSLVISDIVYAELCITSKRNASATLSWKAMKSAYRHWFGRLISSRAAHGGRIGNREGREPESWRIF